MADAWRPTVRELLPPRFQSFDEVARQQIQNDPQFKRMPYNGGVVSEIIGEKVADALREALDCDAFDLLAEGWARAQEIQTIAEETRAAPTTPCTVSLGEHQLFYDAYPVAKVSIAGVGAFELTFKLELAADFQIAQLTLLNGHITEVGKIDCTVGAQLSLGGVPLHQRMAPRPVEILQAVVLKAPGWDVPQARVH